MLGANGYDALIAVAAVLPATIAAIAGLVVTVRARTENREQHAAVSQRLNEVIPPIADKLGAVIPDPPPAATE